MRGGVNLLNFAAQHYGLINVTRRIIHRCSVKSVEAARVELFGPFLWRSCQRDRASGTTREIVGYFEPGME